MYDRNKSFKLYSLNCLLQEQKDDFRPGTSSATSNYKSTGETTNHSRIERILGGPCTGAMQDVLSKEISPLNLLKEVEDHIKKYNLQGKKTAYNDIENKLNIKMNYSEFDITSIYFVLRNICKIKAHSNGWGNDPDVQDKALSAKIDRLRSLKNKYKSHVPKIIIIDDEYEKLCDEIFEIVRHLENILGKSTRYQTVVQWMKTCTMDPEQKIEHEKEKEEIEGNIYLNNRLLGSIDKNDNIRNGIVVKNETFYLKLLFHRFFLYLSKNC